MHLLKAVGEVDGQAGDGAAGLAGEQRVALRTYMRTPRVVRDTGLMGLLQG